MKRGIAWIACCALLLCALLMPAGALADFGSFAGDSDYGSSSDWGSSSWDSGSSWDDDYDSGYSSGVVIFGGGGGGGGFGMLVVLALLIVVFVVMKNRRRSGSQPVQNAGAARTDAFRLRPMEEYSAEDPGFDGAALQEKLSNLYVQMQNAWQDKDIEPIRPYLTDALYAQMDRQLDAMRKAGRTNFIERIAVLGVELRGWYQSGDNDRVVASIRTRIVDYTVEDASGTVVSGDRNRELFMEYEWTLIRPQGQKTGEAAPMQSVHCPSCGAPLSINHSAKCPYCDSVVTLNEHDWVIYEIKGIAQRSAN